MNEPRGAGRKKAVVIALIALVALLVGGGSIALSRRNSARATAGQELTLWQQVMAGTDAAGGTTVEMARQAFSLTFTPLSNVRLPAGRRSQVDSGSAALRMMIAHWSELTVADRTAVLSFLAPSTDPAAKIGLPARRAGLLAFAAAPRPPAVAAPGPDAALEQHIRGRFEAMRAALRSSSRSALTGYIELFFNTRLIEKGAAAYTFAHASGQKVVYPKPDVARLEPSEGAYSGCYVYLNPSAWHEMGPNLDFVLAHELTHCYQGMFVGDLNLYYGKTTSPGWVLDGGANWAAAQVAQDAHRPEYQWQEYLLKPGISLFNQTYEAMGYWNHLDETSGIGVWGLMRSAVGKTNVAAFEASSGSTEAFLDSWASSLFRQPRFGRSWHTAGPTMSSARLSPEELTVPNGGRVSRAAVPYAKALFYAEVQADVVVISAVGHVSLHNASHDDSAFALLVYCGREEGCTCPAGSVNTSPGPDPLGGRAMAFGVTGDAKGAAAALAGISFKDWCAKKNPPKPQRRKAGKVGSGAGGIGNVSGDLCHQIVEREGMDGLLNHPTMTEQDIRDCVAEMLTRLPTGN